MKRRHIYFGLLIAGLLLNIMSLVMFRQGLQHREELADSLLDRWLFQAEAQIQRAASASPPNRLLELAKRSSEAKSQLRDRYAELYGPGILSDDPPVNPPADDARLVALVEALRATCAGDCAVNLEHVTQELAYNDSRYLPEESRRRLRYLSYASTGNTQLPEGTRKALVSRIEQLETEVNSLTEQERVAADATTPQIASPGKAPVLATALEKSAQVVNIVSSLGTIIVLVIGLPYVRRYKIVELRELSLRAKKLDQEIAAAAELKDASVRQATEAADLQLRQLRQQHEQEKEALRIELSRLTREQEDKREVLQDRIVALERHLRFAPPERRG